MIRVHLSQKEVRVGDTLSGRAEWNSDRGKEPRKILVQLRWRLSGKGTSQEQSVCEVVEAEIGGRSQLTIPFAFDVPFFGPLTYSGTLFSVAWEVAARVDLPLAIDEKDSQPVTVRPAIWTTEQFRDFDGNDEFDEEDEDVEPE